jgi:prepilin-type N-terminal cleavage/methylation domain-containing protein
MVRDRGFTLVELLIVIGILALLAGILFSVFGGAKEKARQAQCLSNLKQIGMAALLYKQDFDGEFPLRMEALFPSYVSSAAVFVCPDDASSGEWREKLAKVRGVYTSYTQFVDPLYQMSGQIRLRPDASCSEIAFQSALRKLGPKLPIATCWSHLLPGRYYNVFEFEMPDFVLALLRNDTPSVMPRVEQDGSCRFMKVPQACAYIDVITPYGIAGVSFHDFRVLVREETAELCDGESDGG